MCSATPLRTYPARSPAPYPSTTVTPTTTHFSSIPSPRTAAQPSTFAFARPTNYRRRRPASVVSNEGGGGGSAGSLSLVALAGASGGAITGAAAGTTSSSSFVKIDPQERLVHRGRGVVQIVDAIPPDLSGGTSAIAGGGGGAGVARARQKPKRSNTLTRHCSPPPAPPAGTTITFHSGGGGGDRSRSSSRSFAAPQTTTTTTIPRAPPAELSPSAIRMQVRRGFNDSPRKKKLRARQATARSLFGPNGGAALVRAAMTTDDEARGDGAAPPAMIPKQTIGPREPAMIRTSTTTEDEAGGGGGGGRQTELTATRGWRSDDALFAVPTVRRRYPNISLRTTHPPPPSLPGDQPRSRKGSVISLVVQPVFLSSATPSDVEHAEGTDRYGPESLVEGVRHVFRRASEKVGQPFGTRIPPPSGILAPHHTQEVDISASTTAAPLPIGLLSPSEPSLSLFSASAPCPPAVDDTPALASAALFSPATPVDQLLHEKLAGTPSRRRGSDAAPVATHTAASVHIRSAEGSGSDGYRSRASSALGFRSDDSKSVLYNPTYQYHRDSTAHSSYQQQQQQQHTHIHLRPDGGDAEHDPHHGTMKQAIKSKPIKCPSPRRQTHRNEVQM